MKTETIGSRTYEINTTDLTIQILNTKGRPVKAWKFRDEEHIKKYMQDRRDRQTAHEEYKVKRKIQAQETKRQAVEKIQIGSMFYSSWGYEQTNVDFYQVISIKGMTLQIQKIGAETAEIQSSMSEDVKPVRDSFVDEEILTKRINNYGDINLDSYRSASLIEDENRTFFTSSRA